MFLLVIAGIAAIVAGVAAIWFGIPVKEFSFGNTMILAGAIAICNGLLLMGLGVVVRELKALRRSLRERPLDVIPHATEGHMLPAGSIAGRRPRLDRDEPRVDHIPSESVVPAPLGRPTASRPDDSGGTFGPEAERRDGEEGTLSPEPAPVAPPARARRNLLFSSSRKERGGREAAVKSPVGTPSAASAPDVETRGASQPHPSFNDTWPRGERSPRVEAPVPRRDVRLSPPLQVERERPPAQGEPSATVVKSGTVDGMAYSLYSDGSIEAQMPEGMMRFASIEQLRTHIDRTR